jgi:hypothetical protein
VSTVPNTPVRAPVKGGGVPVDNHPSRPHVARPSRGGRHAARPHHRRGGRSAAAACNRTRLSTVVILLLAIITGISAEALSDNSRRLPPPSSSEAFSSAVTAARVQTSTQADAVHGLGVSYYDNADFTGRSFSGIDRTVNFDWGSGAPAAFIGADTFSARWTGKVIPKSSGPHTFSTYGDDGVRLWVNGQQLVDDWTLHPASERSGSITLTAGQPYDIRMEFYEREGPAVARLLWSSPGVSKAPVPSTQLSPTGLGDDVLVRSLSTAAAPYPVGTPVAVQTKLSAPVSTSLPRLVIAARPKGENTNLDFPLKRDVRVGPTGRTFGFARVFPSPGTYVYWAAIYRNGSWVNLLPQREVTIERERALPPPPSSADVVAPRDDRGDDIAAPAGGPWDLAFHDEFDDTAVDTRKWSTQYPRPDSMCCSNPRNGEAQWYLARNVEEQGGELQLVAKRESHNGFGYSSGLIQSKRSFNFTYGYAAARMWLPKGSGLWPAFWTWPQNERWPPEIDALEFYGDNVRNVYLTYHAPGGSDQSIIRRADWTTGWHTFAVDWRPGSITWYIDGTEVKRRSSDVANVPMYLIANLAIANGSNAPAPTSSTPLPTRLRIDWIRVWKHA